MLFTYTLHGSCLYHRESIYFCARDAGDKYQNHGISAQENSMEEITQEVLDHIPDPIAKIVWEKWIAEGKARLITSHNEGTKCTAQTE